MLSSSSLQDVQNGKELTGASCMNELIEAWQTFLISGNISLPVGITSVDRKCVTAFFDMMIVESSRQKDTEFEGQPIVKHDSYEAEDSLSNMISNMAMAEKLNVVADVPTDNVDLDQDLGEDL